MSEPISPDQLAKQSQAFIDEYLKLAEYKGKLTSDLMQKLEPYSKFELLEADLK